MHLSASAIRHHIEYTTWATERLLTAVTELSADELTHDFGAADKSILGTLIHIFRAERIWLTRIQVGSPAASWARPEDEQLTSLLTEWSHLHFRWKNWAAALSDSDGDRIVQYADLRDNPSAEPVWQLVLHVVNHSTHHRGQASGFLRALGKRPPQLDLIRFVRESAKS